jgi:2-oxoglutarate ferredoxin oxidoreductase subunit alpha
MQARWGSHGDYEVIAFAPASPQEMFDCTIKAFNHSEKYRLPVFVLSDEVVGHMTERVVIPNKKDLKIYNRRKPKIRKDEYLPFEPSDKLVPPMVNAGDGYHVHFTGLTHDERGYPAVMPEVQENLVRRLVDKIRKNVDDIIECEELYTDDAKIVVVAYGITARVALYAIRIARKKGVKVGFLRLITVWPFPEEKIRNLSENVDIFVVPEINYGQIFYEVQRCSSKHTILVPKMGGAIHKPVEILDVIYKNINKRREVHANTSG